MRQWRLPTAESSTGTDLLDGLGTGQAAECQRCRCAFPEASEGTCPLLLSIDAVEARFCLFQLSVVAGQDSSQPSLGRLEVVHLLIDGF